MTRIEIPYLPEPLGVVPPAPFGPDDPEASDKRDAYLHWRDAVMRYRLERRREIERDPGFIPYELARCSQSCAYWLTTWGVLWEPRQRDTGSGPVPFIPFAKQLDVVETILWALEQKDENADVVISKCREVGGSWIVVAVALWGWLFKTPWSVKLVSRNENMVDSALQESLFWKVDNLYDFLPAWMKPKGFDPDKHRQKMKLINPENKNELGGESTTSKSGRGARVLFAVFDEAALIPDFLKPWNGMAASTDHRIAVSTVNNVEGPAFNNLTTGEGMDYRPHLVEIDWWNNPMFTLQYIETKRKQMASEPGSFEREYLRDMRAGNTTFVYPRAYDLKQDDAVRPLLGATTYLVMDPGHRDPTALLLCQEIGGDLNFLDSYQNAGQPADFFAPLCKPELLGDSRLWVEKEHVTWSPPDSEETYVYGFVEIDFMRSVLACGGVNYYVGDVYGDNVQGATSDSYYSRLARRSIHFNRDRRTAQDAGMYLKTSRTYLGRQQAVNGRLATFRFGPSRGAEIALAALKNSMYAPTRDKGVMNEPQKPLHDQSSHLRSCFEYLCVYLKRRVGILNRDLSKKTGRTRLGAQIGNMGSARRHGNQVSARG